MRTFLAAALLVLPAVTGRAGEAVRDGRFAITAGVDSGRTAGDPSAQLRLVLEYGIWEHLAVGAGYAYVDGLHPLQQHCLELFAKGYLLGQPLDLSAAAALQAYLRDAGGLGAVFTARAGMEWASPWKFFLGSEVGLVVEPEGVGYQFGSFLGVRF